MSGNFQDRDVCIIGLGYVGLTLAVALAEVGYRVRGVERDSKVVERIRSGRAHFAETGLDQRLGAQVAAGNLDASTEWPRRGECKVYIITVGTPVDAEKRTKLDALAAVAKVIASLLAAGDIVVLRSTVRVGVTRELVKPILDKANVAYDLAFCPERTLEGKALIELRSLPQIIGGLGPDAATRATGLFSRLTPTTITVADPETAEMIKLVNNTQRDLLFAFANEVAAMCEAVGVSAAEVARAGNAGYPRASLPIPGPVGGPCLEKDPYILAEGVRLKGGDAPLALLGRKTNEQLPAKAVALIREMMADRPVRKIAICGLAFKGRPETSDLRGSPAFPLISELRAAFPAAAICGYDPVVPELEIKETLGIAHVPTLEQAFDGADIVCSRPTMGRSSTPTLLRYPNAYSRTPLSMISGISSAARPRTLGVTSLSLAWVGDGRPASLSSRVRRFTSHRERSEQCGYFTICILASWGTEASRKTLGSCSRHWAMAGMFR